MRLLLSIGRLLISASFEIAIRTRKSPALTTPPEAKPEEAPAPTPERFPVGFQPEPLPEVTHGLGNQ